MWALPRSAFFFNGVQSLKCVHLAWHFGKVFLETVEWCLVLHLWLESHKAWCSTFQKTLHLLRFSNTLTEVLTSSWTVSCFCLEEWCPVGLFRLSDWCLFMSYIKVMFSDFSPNFSGWWALAGRAPWALTSVGSYLSRCVDECIFLVLILVLA